MNARYLLAACFLGWLFAGCTFDDTRKHCASEADCGDGDRCFKGFCVPPRLSTSDIGGQGNSGESAAGGKRGMDSGTAGKGGSGPSTPDSGGSSECSGDATRDCSASWEDAVALGGCGPGTQHCLNGIWGSCTPERMMITTESCNNLDDDCDGNTDEDSDVPCFPENAAGCQSNGQGNFNCRAPCKAGVQTCSDGRLLSCSGDTVAEAKDNCATEQIDENCDGALNDECKCMTDMIRDCYTGPDNTKGVGICTVGKQQCVSGQWAACNGAVMQQLEICNGKDDDCNNKLDDVVGLGTRCTVAAKLGVCSEGTFQCIAGKTSLQCVATAPIAEPETCDGKDNDCNGMIDDVPASQLQTDSANCGACKKVCSGSDKCCAGSCVNPMTDEKNCGTCGKSCTGTDQCNAAMCMSTQPADAGTMCGTGPSCAGALFCCNGACVPSDSANCGKCGMLCNGVNEACCSNSCVDLSTSASNCGKCGSVCPTLDGGVACTCATTGTPGMFECRNGTTTCQ